MPDFKEYENGVADILSFLVGDSATVERNVRVASKRGGRKRQVDVLVRGRVFGLDDTTLAVDCKLRKRSITADDLDAFLGFLDDIAVDLGLLVASSGYSPAAKSRLQHERGVHAEVVTLDELSSWSPKGTIHVSFRLPADDAKAAAKALRSAGLRVRQDPALSRSPEEVVLNAFGHFGEPTADRQRELAKRAETALMAAGLPVDTASSGVSMGGGTPAHRWLEVTDRSGERLGFKVLAGTEDEAKQECERVAAVLGLAGDSLDVERPDGWPMTGFFGSR
ncbi:MAG: restriction endonuclease [Solirubrobacteraceae bacterium]